jgi:hypothetical protein
MGAALNAKRTGKASFPLAGKIAGQMSEKQLTDFATKPISPKPPGQAPKQLKTSKSMGINPRTRKGSYL